MILALWKTIGRRKKIFALDKPLVGKTSGGMYNIELSRKAAKFYQKADTSTVKRLNLAFAKLAEAPFQQYNIKRLSGELKGSFRLRLGDMRIIYSVDECKNIVYIEVIGFRGDVYKS
jgi:mRNA interferase RelE/StbE